MKNKIEFFLSEILYDKETDIQYHIDSIKPGVRVMNRAMNIAIILYDLQTDPKKYFMQVEPYIAGLGKNQKPKTFEIQDDKRIKDIMMDVLDAYNFKEARRSNHYMGYVRLFNNYLMGKDCGDSVSFKTTRKKIELRIAGQRTVPFINVADLDILIKKINQSESAIYPHSININNLPEDKSSNMVKVYTPIYFNKLVIDKYPYLNKKKSMPHIDGLSLNEEDFFKEINKFERVNLGSVLKAIILETKLDNQKKDGVQSNTDVINKIKSKI